MTRVFFIQPAVPKYRIAFFEKLKKYYNINIITCNNDFLGVKTVYNDESVTLLPGFKSMCAGRIQWCRNLSFFGYRKNDLVIVNGNPRIINYMLLLIFLKMRGIKTVWWGHGWTANSYGLSSKVRIFIMKMLSSTYLFYTDDEVFRMKIENSYALNNGLDSEGYNNFISQSKVTREIPSKSVFFDLVYIGRITEKANFKLLLNSLKDSNENIRLNVIGSCDDLEKYKLLADNLGIKERVSWQGALYDDKVITDIMLKSHAFIYSGSVGLSLIHAFNYGLPAIIHSSFDSHMPEFSAFREGYNGFSFENNNKKSLVDTMNKLYELDDNKYLSLVSNAFETVKISYNVDDMVLRFNTMMKNV